jgi:hypothetical protein
MLMTIRYEGGQRVEAVLLAADHKRMRVAVASQRDAVELIFVDGCWYVDQGPAIEIEALVAIPADGVRMCADKDHRAQANGRSSTAA